MTEPNQRSITDVKLHMDTYSLAPFHCQLMWCTALNYGNEHRTHQSFCQCINPTLNGYVIKYFCKEHTGRLNELNETAGHREKVYKGQNQELEYS